MGRLRERRSALLRVALDISRNVGRSTAKRILPERSWNNCLALNPKCGHRERSNAGEMPVGTVSRSRAETVDRQRRGAMMLTAATATCRNGLLRLHEGQNESCKLQEQHETGKRPAHEEQIVLHHEAQAARGRPGRQTLQWEFVLELCKVNATQISAGENVCVM